MRNNFSIYTRKRLYAILLVLLGPNAVHANIYVVQAPDGQLRFTNTFVDQHGYQVFIATAADTATNSKSQAFHTSSEQWRKTLNLVRNTAQKYAVDPALVTAIIAVESGFNPNAQSSKGALGLMQLMPSTAKQYGVSNSKDPTENVIAGTKHLRSLLDRHNGNVPLALAAYNAGDAPVLKHAKRIPPYPETMLYVSKVLALYERYRNHAAN